MTTTPPEQQNTCPCGRWVPPGRLPPARSVRRHQPGGTYDRAVRLVNASDRRWRVKELVRAMRDEGWDAQVLSDTGAVRSALDKAWRRGAVSRVAAGVYGAIDREPAAVEPESP